MLWQSPASQDAARTGTKSPTQASSQGRRDRIVKEVHNDFGLLVMQLRAVAGVTFWTNIPSLLSHHTCDVSSYTQ